MAKTFDELFAEKKLFADLLKVCRDEWHHPVTREGVAQVQMSVMLGYEKGDSYGQWERGYNSKWKERRIKSETLVKLILIFCTGIESFKREHAIRLLQSGGHSDKLDDFNKDVNEIKIWFFNEFCNRYIFNLTKDNAINNANQLWQKILERLDISTTIKSEKKFYHCLWLMNWHYQ